ncbi:YdcF family protein [Fibrella sp. HMF5335]|uniref:YdcF family protein n=1 Tax=Fibrella rubiginis TaxID=2817060 RepID=A0A939JZY0_9BACT|nr:YdcF family protein [Fibrella rubiginis]MBO0935512.1 YdcF family protein [Fibrella rubiginis]
MKYVLPLAFFLLFFSLHAQTPTGYQRSYRPFRSGDVVADKQFYLLTAIEQLADVKQFIEKDTALLSIQRERATLIKTHAGDTCRSPVSLVTGFRWAAADSARLQVAMGRLYDQNRPAFDKLVNGHLRPSGYYQRFVDLPNRALLARAWGQYVVGINYIIDQYGLGKKLRYPRIDSANYPVNGRTYRTVLKDMFAVLAERADSLRLFYQPSLAVARQLMDVNDRDEPARHEPMEQRDNRAAANSVGRTVWKNYRYAAMMVPGSGPELTTTPLSPLNKMRLDLVAARYRAGWAPLVVVSGGYCYPFRGPYAEAVEMKRYLMQRWQLPEAAIIIDPHARHTTTNFRNANRLLIRYGVPTDKPCVMVSTKSQTDYVDNAAFDARNQRELGYLPYRDKHRISPHDVVFYPTPESLHMDPYDPLDP